MHSTDTSILYHKHAFTLYTHACINTSLRYHLHHRNVIYKVQRVLK